MNPSHDRGAKAVLPSLCPCPPEPARARARARVRARTRVPWTRRSLQNARLTARLRTGPLPGPSARSRGSVGRLATRSRGEISAGAVKGMNNKLKLTVRKAYGLRTLKATEVALTHAIGDLAEPPTAHRFC